MRPRGELALAMLGAAEAGPAPVRVLAQRAQVGYAAARYTASRLVSMGSLVVLHQARPAVLAVPPRQPQPAQPEGDADGVPRSFWEWP